MAPCKSRKQKFVMSFTITLIHWYLLCCIIIAWFSWHRNISARICPFQAAFIEGWDPSWTNLQQAQSPGRNCCWKNPAQSNSAWSNARNDERYQTNMHSLKYLSLNVLSFVKCAPASNRSRRHFPALTMVIHVRGWLAIPIKHFLEHFFHFHNCNELKS